MMRFSFLGAGIFCNTTPTKSNHGEWKFSGNYTVRFVNTSIKTAYKTSFLLTGFFRTVFVARCGDFSMDIMPIYPKWYIPIYCVFHVIFYGNDFDRQRYYQLCQQGNVFSINVSLCFKSNIVNNNLIFSNNSSKTEHWLAQRKKKSFIDMLSRSMWTRQNKSTKKLETMKNFYEA